MLSWDTRAAHRELERKLRPFVARRVPAPDVDDVLQDVFLRMQSGLSQLEDKERFGPWLYRVARSAVFEHARKRARHPLPKEAPDAELLPALPEEPEAGAERELAGCIVPFVAQLASPYREALTLTELEGLTQKDAADALGLSVSGMKSRVQRGRQKLREALESCCQIDLDARGGVLDCERRGGGRGGCGCGA